MDLTGILGAEPVADAEEEAFLVFSQTIPSHSLGIIDSQAPTLDITVAGYDLTIHQSRGLLTSDRALGTTGAVLWSITPLFATWLSLPSNILTTHDLLTSSTTVLELGTGISGILALTLAPRIAHYTATDQDYVLKLLRHNIAANSAVVFPRDARQKTGAKGGKSSSKVKVKEKGRGNVRNVMREDRISVQALDWETNDVSHMPPVDMLFACDCIYNEALIEPLNSTCAALCRLRQEQGGQPTLCVIAQQLRSPEVFETWLKSFCKLFQVWQVPGSMLGEGLGEGSGFVVYVGLVR
ncbi:Ribosomal protein lysine methyltransferase [Coniothyrium glycines]